MRPSKAGPRVTFMVATERGATADGEKREVTDYHRVVVAGPLANACEQDLAEGDDIHVEGTLVNRGFVRNGERRFITEIHAHLVGALSVSPDSKV